jgi:hypothetical protein
MKEGRLAMNKTRQTWTPHLEHPSWYKHVVFGRLSDLTPLVRPASDCPSRLPFGALAGTDSL